MLDHLPEEDKSEFTITLLQIKKSFVDLRNKDYNDLLLKSDLESLKRVRDALASTAQAYHLASVNVKLRELKESNEEPKEELAFDGDIEISKETTDLINNLKGSSKHD